jgi:ubiquinone biosynthesis accessory factor UbiJ
MDPMVFTAAFVGIEKILKVALAYDPGLRIALNKLAPQVLALEISNINIRCYLAIEPNAIRVLGHFEGETSARVSGTSSALFLLLRNEQTNLKDSGVSISGDVLFVAELQKIINKMDIDWEEMLCAVLGDIAGHQGAEIVRKKIEWTKDRAKNFQRLTGEFLTEEFRVLPSKPETNWFNQQVDTIRLATDRLEKRINLIAKSVQRQSNP